MSTNLIIIVVSAVATIILSFLFGNVLSKRRSSKRIEETEEKSQLILKEAEIAAELVALVRDRIGPVAATHPVTGEGVLIPESYDPDGFRARHGIDGPFVYYAGRREWAKGWTELLDAFSRVHRTAGLRLVTLSNGSASVAQRLRPNAVWPSASNVSSEALSSCRDSATASWYGVSGSPVVPRTRIGSAPAASTGAGVRTGSAGQLSQVVPP